MSTFRCGHPREGNSISTGVPAPSGERYSTCGLCFRVRAIVRRVERDQKRINAGLPVDRRIGSGAAWL